MNPTEFRRHLHAHPELSFKEHATAAFIADRLTELGIEHRPIARTGVLARIEGHGKADPKRRAIVLRAAGGRATPASCTPAATTCTRLYSSGYCSSSPPNPTSAARSSGCSSRAKSATRAGRRWYWPKTRSKGTRYVPWWANTSSRSWRSGRWDSAPGNTWPPATNCASRYTARAGTAPCARS